MKRWEGCKKSRGPLTVYNHPPPPPPLLHYAVFVLFLAQSLSQLKHILQLLNQIYNLKQKQETKFQFIIKLGKCTSYLICFIMFFFVSDDGRTKRHQSRERKGPRTKVKYFLGISYFVSEHSAQATRGQYNMPSLIVGNQLFLLSMES